MPNVTLADLSRLTGVKLKKFTVATLPPAARREGRVVYVSNGAAGSATLAFSDGTNWKRVDTLANISAS
jgi:hypothetical protein